MSFITIGLSAATMLVMAIVLSYILGWANKAFHVEVDPKITAINEALPAANCGGCGYVGCGEYAEAVAEGSAPVNKCTVGGESCAAEVAEIMGVTVEESYPYRPVVHCGATLTDRLQRSQYIGEQRCAPANLVTGIQGCTYGCLGFGDCERACNFDAIEVVEGLGAVNYDKCVGCGACAEACPRNIISMVPFKAEQMLAVGCSNKDHGKEVKAVCKVGCLGCKACTRVSDMFTVEDNLSTINYENYRPDRLDELLAASNKCPRNRLVFVGKPTDKDLSAAEGLELPEVVKPDFKTTVDDTEWRG